MKILPLLLLVLIAFSAPAQKIIRTKRASGHSIHVWGDDFEGVVFKKEYQPYPSDTPKNINFTPTILEIELAENYLRQSLDTLVSTYHLVIDGKKWIDSVPGNAVSRSLRYYIRQYFGYIDKNGQKIVWVNCFYRYGNVYPNKKEWFKQMVSVWDGGKAFWNVKVNLDKKCLFGLSINGPAWN